PGSGSLMTAASAWNAIAAELQSAALSYQNVVTQLASEEWAGTASATMAAAATPYAEWLATTAAQAEQAAVQASSAAAAYEAAFSAVVPPPVIAANRALVQQLQATNVIGQNTGAIAQLEAQYGEFWAQDAGAMANYSVQSTAATKGITQFQAAPKVTNDAGTATQSSTVANAAANTSASNTANTVQKAATTATTTAAPQAAAAATTTDPLQELWFLLTGQTTIPTNLGAAVNGYSPFASLFYNTEGLPYFSTGMANTFTQISKTVGLIGGAAPAAAKALPGLGGLGGLLGGGAGAVHPAAAIGGAASIGGKLSVPVAWTGGPAVP
ncbi:PPE family protein, partial [Mycobacterium paraffinicum]|uniref:PPE family protein n=1 Tax=Mycobacterium paraffinicum TaxID=53378 RepID=UPI0031E69529